VEDDMCNIIVTLGLASGVEDDIAAEGITPTLSGTIRSNSAHAMRPIILNLAWKAMPFCSS
jgi:hypothetical protein